jgi:hypothetical protein
MTMIISIFFLVVMLFTCVFAIRNVAVYSERMRTNDVIFSQEEWWHYLDLKHTVSYNDMMLRFWVWPVHKMWPQELQDLSK